MSHSRRMSVFDYGRWRDMFSKTLHSDKVINHTIAANERYDMTKKGNIHESLEDDIFVFTSKQVATATHISIRLPTHSQCNKQHRPFDPIRLCLSC